MQKIIPVPQQAIREEDDAAEHAVEKLRDELELLGHAISHDLQAPLRIIQSCAEELTAASSTHAQDSVQMMQRESARLKTMLQGMLDYIRLETFSVSHVLVDCNDIVQTAMVTLSEEIEASGAIITHDTLPKLLGHRGRLIRLFSHLLGNAIKFHGEDPPKIHISATRRGDLWEFCIADQGIGMSEEQQDVIFRLFQRLHQEGTYPGQGIGLALSRKIIETHNGTLWVESAPNQGSRFFFTLPVIKN